MKLAYFVRNMTQAENWLHDARLYRLSEPAPVLTWDGEPIGPHSPTTEYVVVNSVPCDWQGNRTTSLVFTDSTGFCPLLAMKNQVVIYDVNAHEEALNRFGYQLAK